MTANTNTWIRLEPSSTPFALRLFCFPFAGGGAAAFRPWRGIAATHGIEICAAHLPGREARHRERPFTDIYALTDALTVNLLPFLDERPFAFFGHSVGALMAYELARRLRDQGYPSPRGLFVSAHRAPHCPRSRPILHSLPEQQFCDALRVLGGTPTQVLDDADMRRMFFPVLRADLSMTDHYFRREADPLSCPIRAFAGKSDPQVDVEEMHAWSDITHANFDLSVFDAGHFFLREHSADILSVIAQNTTSS